MFAGLLIVATTLSASFGPPVQYRITIHSNRNLDRSTSGEEARGGTYTAVAFVTASWSSGNDGRRMAHMVVDSVRCAGTGIMSMAFDTVVGQHSRGASYDFPIGNRLEVVPTPSISNILTNTLAQTALMLFPTIDAQAHVGSVWTDSLDTSPMGDPSDKNHPVLTHWRVIAVGGDSVIAEGDVRGALSSSGRVVGTGLISGTRRLTARNGMLQALTSTLNQETLMAVQEGTAIVRGSGSTTLEIIPVTHARMTP